MRHRGYALGIVLLVSLLLSALLVSMFMRLSASTKSAGRFLGLRRSHYLCDGVVNIASDILRAAAPRTSTLAQLDAELEGLRTGVVADGVIIDELRAEPTDDSHITSVPSGPFAGLGVTVVDLELRIALRANGVPPCRVSETQPLASVSFLQLPAFSALQVDVTETPTFVVEPESEGLAWGATGATVDMPEPTPPSPPPKNPPPKRLVLKPRNGALDAPLALPKPIDGTDVRPGLRFLVEQPTTTERPSGSRLALGAGLRIIDGEWYAAGSGWPGTILWSDHPCSNELRSNECSNIVDSTDTNWRNPLVATRRLYSRYERNGLGLIDGLAGGGSGAGVVSYGALDGDAPAGFLASSVCRPAAGNIGVFGRPTTCQRFEGADGPALVGKGGPQAALVEATRGGFGDADEAAPVLPINIDLGLLGAAMRENRNGELGTHACLPGASGGCPDTQLFNGVLYISASHGARSGDAPGTITFPAPDSRNQARLPWALCGVLSSAQASFEGGEGPGILTGDFFADCDEDNWARIDAVRLVRGADLSAFAATGLTIVSDLPVYVQGNFNTVGVNHRVAIVAERVTFLSSAWRDDASPPLTPTVPLAPTVATPLSARVSLLTGALAPVGSIADVVRVLEPKVDVTIVGGLGTLFASPVRVVNHPAKLTWQYPRALLAPELDSQPPGVPRGSFILPSTRGGP